MADTTMSGAAGPSNRSLSVGESCLIGTSAANTTMPVTMPTPIVRMRSVSLSASCSDRAASAVRKAPARKAHVPTAMSPPNSEVGWSHELSWSPLPSAGTRPDATAPGGRAEEERRDQRRPGEHDAEQPRLGQGRGVLAEREARAAQHDADQRQRERQRERRGRRGERLGEAGPPDHQDVDQPDVVGLPHRTDAVVDQGAQLAAALGSAGGQVEEPGAEVGAAEQGVQHDAREHRDRDDDCQAHRAPASSTVAVPGPYGLGRSSSPARHRRAIERSTTNAPIVMPT